MKKIISAVGARPNFIKIAPVHRALLKHAGRIEHRICHTGQHFDENMSRIFFDELELPKPDFHLGVGSGTQAAQTAMIMTGFEKVLLDTHPDLVVVTGDVNSTLACALVAVKLHIPVAHVEAGLRSFDRTMPEEINRMVTDMLADFLFVTEKSGLDNLAREGIPHERIFFTGNVMIDSLLHFMPRIQASTVLSDLSLDRQGYILVTFHRPGNVDNKGDLARLVTFLNGLSERRMVVFPVHPRTRANLLHFGLDKEIGPQVHITGPMGYFEFLALEKDALMVVTDSGGIQEETTFLGVPCITVRDSTERPVTVELGTNYLAGTDFTRVLFTAQHILSGEAKKGRIPELWDGRTAERIVEILAESLDTTGR
jgi:UDP-N-acetylglucosamine 2-epimerase (non-hydrolysing)